MLVGIKEPISDMFPRKVSAGPMVSRTVSVILCTEIIAAFQIGIQALSVKARRAVAACTPVCLFHRH
jgi:hypothetical protein